MSAIIEPEAAQWWSVTTPRLRVSATPEDRSVVLHRTYQGGAHEEIEIKLDELAEVESLLLNARLWLERAVKQRDEMKAAEEVGQDEDTDPTRDDQVLRLASFFITMLGRRP